jgi:hypothetical protein
MYGLKYINFYLNSQIYYNTCNKHLPAYAYFTSGTLHQEEYCTILPLQMLNANNYRAVCVEALWGRYIQFCANNMQSAIV